MKKILQSKIWYVTGDYYTKPKNNIILRKDSTSDFDWKAIFLPSGKLINSLITKESFFTSMGEEIPAGFPLTDSTATYKVNENTLIIDYSLTKMIRIVEYKIIPLENKKGYEFVLIKSTLKDH